MLKRAIQGAALVALLTGTAVAQQDLNLNVFPNPQEEKRVSPEDRERQRQIDERYRETVRSLPDKKGSSDPWGNVRQAPAAATKQSKKQP